MTAATTAWVSKRESRATAADLERPAELQYAPFPTADAGSLPRPRALAIQTGQGSPDPKRLELRCTVKSAGIRSEDRAALACDRGRQRFGPRDCAQTVSYG